jgi:hypothetical protein
MNIEELFLKFREQDPDFAKVDNSIPSREFAFEIQDDLTVENVAAFSDDEARERIKALDDYDRPVVTVPLMETSRVLYFNFCGRTVNLPLKDDSAPIPLFVHVISLLLVQIVSEHPEKFDLLISRSEVRSLRFWRFYFDTADGWWHVTFDDTSEPTGIAEQDAP